MNTGSLKEKIDRIWIGLTMGVIMPVVISLILYYSKYHYVSWEWHMSYPKLYAPLLQMGAIGNLFMFFTFNHFDMLRAQRGVLLATLFIALILVGIIYF